MKSATSDVEIKWTHNLIINCAWLDIDPDHIFRFSSAARNYGAASWKSSEITWFISGGNLNFHFTQLISLPSMGTVEDVWRAAMHSDSWERVYECLYIAIRECDGLEEGRCKLHLTNSPCKVSISIGWHLLSVPVSLSSSSAELTASRSSNFCEKCRNDGWSWKEWLSQARKKFERDLGKVTHRFWQMFLLHQRGIPEYSESDINQPHAVPRRRFIIFPMSFFNKMKWCWNIWWKCVNFSTSPQPPGLDFKWQLKWLNA